MNTCEGEQTTESAWPKFTKMKKPASYSILPIDFIRSGLKRRKKAPRQGSEGAPNAALEANSPFLKALEAVVVGQELVILT